MNPIPPIPEDLQERIAAYIDGELPASEAARLEVFLANSDPALANRVVGMIADRQAVRALPKMSAPKELVSHVMEQIERASLLHNVEQMTPAPRRWWQSKGAIAAGVAVLLGGFSYLVLTSVISPSGAKTGNPLAKQTAVGGAAAGGRRIAEAPRAERQVAAAPQFDRASVADAPEKNELKDAVAHAEELAGDKEKPLASGPALALGGAAPFGVTDNTQKFLPVPAEPAPAIIAAAPTRAVVQPPADEQAAAVVAGTTTRESLNQSIASAGGAPGAAPGGVNAGGGRGGRGGRGAGGAGGGAGGAAAAGPLAAGRAARARPNTPDALNAPTAPATDSPARALATVTKTPGEQPIVLTLVARDADDSAKITAALDTYATNNRKTDSTYAMQQQNFTANGSNFANGVTTLNNGGNVNWNNDTQRAQFSANNSIGQQAAPQNSTAPGPFRVALKAEQLRELADHYRVAVIARGPDTYVFGQVGDHLPATADKAGREDILRRAGFPDSLAPNNRNAQPPAAPMAPSKANGATANSGLTITPAPAPTRDTATAPAFNWFDCIITIEPAPATPPPPATAPAPAN